MEVPSTKVIHPTLPVQSVERSSGAVGPRTRVGEGPSGPIASLRIRLIVSLTLTFPRTQTTTSRYWSSVPRLRSGFTWSRRAKLSFLAATFLRLLGSYLFWVIQITNATFLVFSERPTPFVTGFRRFGSFIASPSARVPHIRLYHLSAIQ